MFGGSVRRKIKRTAEKSSTTPIKILRIAADGWRNPPRYAAGIESSANGQNSLHEKWPARQNCNVPIVATKTFSTSAVGRMIVAVKPNNVIVAM